MDREPIQALRERSLREVQAFKKKHADHTYTVGLENNLHRIKQALIAKVNQS
jgi:hypothetical protein